MTIEIVGQDDTEPSQSPPILGTIVGHVALPDQGGTPQAVLLPPEWAQTWDREVQERIDGYSSQYRSALVDNPARFEAVSRMARRDAVASVVLQMQGKLGVGFGELVRSVSPQGRFEYSGVPVGDYKILVLVERGQDPLIWIEAVSLRDSIPFFVELEDRIQ